MRGTRAAAPLLDAAVVSLGGFGLSWVGARYLPLAEFGEFAVLVTAALVVAGAVKAFLVEPYTLGRAHLDEDRRKAAARRVVASAAAVALALSVLLLAGAAAGRGGPGSLAVLACALPPIVVLDALRWIAYADGRAASALRGSAVCAGMTLVGAVALVGSGRATAPALLAVWGCAAATAAVTTVVRSALRPDPRGIARWVADGYRVGVPSLADFGLSQATGLAGSLLIAALVDAEQYGALRLAMLPFAAAQLVFTAAIAASQPVLVVHVAAGRGAEAGRLARRVVAGCAAAVVVVAAALVGVPAGLMERVWGEHWAGAVGLVPVVAVGLLFSAVTAGCGPYLRACGLLRHEVVVKAVTAPLTLAAVVVGAVLHGAAGGALGQAAGVLLVACGLAARAVRPGHAPAAGAAR